MQENRPGPECFFPRSIRELPGQQLVLFDRSHDSAAPESPIPPHELGQSEKSVPDSIPVLGRKF